ncbi:putative dicarboxylate carrier protein [Luteitalea sp. TBR-22]|uniref:SLC13 family permease n=1 Tax=Luteitalea sp. TBR-22 TaxID=2802971 RepID=UPI001AFB0C44|nr:SLC13 family permease [Luteitalea sp. TBR-22]BCS32807.1 putative dicarboxylate carrier protein [Luteitalea sp. TBR-22]
MSPAALSVLALVLVMAASFGTRLNVGVLAVALAWPIAVYVAGWKPDALMAVFPASLFVTLLGVTLLFGITQANGTMAALTQRALRACGGRAGWLPAMLFGLSCTVSAMGPGAIAASALLAPVGMAAGVQAGLSPLLAALMIGNGANAGNLSPFSAVGVIVAAGMVKAGVPGHAWQVFAANFVAHLLAAGLAWLAFGGPRLLRDDTRVDVGEVPPLTRQHWLTLAVGAAWVVAVVGLKVNLGLAAFAAASVLVLLRACEDGAMLRQVPWAVIVMVCGVSVLIGVLEGTGGLDLFSGALARIATPASVNGVIAFVTGAISTYSSTSGVVYPTFLPAIPSLVAKLGGGDPLQIALSINVGAALVDVSPLSTIGALCIAALPAGEQTPLLFRRMLTWGLAMTLVGAAFCQFGIRFFAFR